MTLVGFFFSSELAFHVVMLKLNYRSELSHMLVPILHP